MKAILKTLVLILTISSTSFAQEGGVGIGTTSPDPSAILDLVSTDKGLLIPRMTTQQMMDIESPQEGLIIFDTEKKALCAYSTSTSWQILGLLPDGNPNDLLQLDANGKPFWAPFAGAPQLSDGDNDTKIEVEKNSDEDQIRFTLGGSEKINVDSDGNISLSRDGGKTIGIEDNVNDVYTDSRGIFDLTIKAGGRTARTNTTSVGGNLNLRAGNSNMGNFIIPESNDVNIYAGDNLFKSSNSGNIRFYAGSNQPERLRLVGDSGFLGLGELNPNAPLSIQRTVASTSPNYLQLLHNRTNTSGANALIGFSVSGADIGVGNFTPAAIGFDRSQGLVFQTQSGSGNPPTRMSISGSGVVRIHELGGSGTQFLVADNNGIISTSNVGTFAIYQDGLSNIPGSTFGRRLSGPANGQVVLDINANDANDGFYIRTPTNLATTQANRVSLSVKGSGRVGIGTNNPSTNMHVLGSSSSGHVAKIENTSSNTNADGLEIKLNSNTNHLNDFISFTDNTGVRGRIEGQTTIVDVINNSVADLIAQLILNANDQSESLLDFSGIDIDYQPLNFEVELLPEPGVEIDLPKISIGEKSVISTLNSKVNQITNIAPDKSKFDAVWNELGNVVEGINTEYLVTTIVLGIDVIRSFIELATCSGSIFDPEDCFVAGMNVATAALQLGVWVGYWQFFSSGVALQTGAGDYAEWLEKEDPSEFITNGDIVGVKGGKISKHFDEAERFMAISTAPALAGNMPQPEFEKDYEMVAFMGQIPVKVKGKVEKGDYILPSGEGDGIAIAVNPKDMLALDYKRVVGVAWDESKDQEFFTMVNTAVGINQNDLANIVDQMQKVMNQMQVAIKDINPDYELNLFVTSGDAKRKETDLAYSVGRTHPSQISKHFENLSFKSEKEKNIAVKEALQTIGNVDFEKVPALAMVLENPDKSDEIVAYYSEILKGLEGLMGKMTER